MKRMSTAALAVVAVFSFTSTAALAQEPDKKTARVWKSKCASCHGADGVGDTKKGKEQEIINLTTAKWQAGTTDDAIKKTITEPQTKDVGGKKEDLHGFGSELKPDQVDALVAFIRGLKK